jgi:hypothetical protein
VTTGTLILTAFIALTLFATNEYYGLIGGIILCILLIGTMIYFYAISLDKIILESEMIILKKNIGQINIPKSDIMEVSKLGFSNLTMTYGSKGVFGFIGNTMDNSVSLVKDRKSMIQIKTKDKNFILSSEKPDKLVKDIKTLYSIV